jgi:hypothetical protein
MFRQIRELLLILLAPMALWPYFADAADLIVPDQFATIASALTRAANNTDTFDTIILRRGTYSEHITLIDNVSLRGDETARTIIDGNGAGTVITAARGSTIQRLTITNGDMGVAIPSSATQVTVKNTIIINHNTSGIQCAGANAATISYNTLDSNGIAVTCTNSANLTITNNIISNNTENDITVDQSTAIVNNNLFFNNGNEDYVDTQLRNQEPELTDNIFEPKVDDANPLFVNPNNNDFHLQSGPPTDPNPAITADPDDNEIGAYGDNNPDPPLPLSNLRVTPGAGTITVEWDKNLAYNIQGYRVYYDSDEANPPYAQQFDPGDVSTTQISGLSTSVTAVPPPDLRVGIGDTELLLNWTPLGQPSVVQYKIYYGTSSGNYSALGSPVTINGRNSSSYLLTNLVNQTTYYMAISTIAATVYFVTVTVLDNQSKQSDFAPVQETHLTGNDVESSLSAEINATPEQVVRFPNLSNEGGCFIATAAYGSPLESHVQTLRTFRDRHLLTNFLGRKFVAFYYQTSPPLARWLEEHASFKPAVRAILSPIVLVTELWMDITSFARILIIILVLSLAGFSVYRCGLLRWGGHY